MIFDSVASPQNYIQGLSLRNHLAAPMAQQFVVDHVVACYGSGTMVTIHVAASIKCRRLVKAESLKLVAFQSKPDDAKVPPHQCVAVLHRLRRHRWPLRTTTQCLSAISLQNSTHNTRVRVLKPHRSLFHSRQWKLPIAQTMCHRFGQERPRLFRKSLGSWQGHHHTATN